MGGGRSDYDAARRGRLKRGQSSLKIPSASELGCAALLQHNPWRSHMPDWIGRTLSKVEIQKLLGRGGMAEVYLGRHTTLHRPVAVKVLFSHLADDPDLLARFEREAQAVAALRHPNIVQVFDFDVVDGRPFIVMELLQGPSLADYLTAQRRAGGVPSGPLPPDTVVRLVADVA